MIMYKMLINGYSRRRKASSSCGSSNFMLGRFLGCETETITALYSEIARASETGWVLRRDPVFINDGDLKQVHLFFFFFKKKEVLSALAAHPLTLHMTHVLLG